jgi:alpha-beta hydrolase superfamily lysophospholipase
MPGMDEVVDVLGEPWTCRTIALRPDAVSRATGTDPVASLVSRRDVDPDRIGVLYVHGFVDYFFQAHLGQPLADAGYQLYALDLRDCGRSRRPGRPVDTTNHLATYAEEIDLAVKALQAVHRQVVLLGHSTGGLIAALWADARPDVLDALVLNSPWLDLRGSWLERTALTWALDAVGAVRPELVVSHLDPHYGKALHVSTGGEWDYDLAWKPYDNPPVTAGFIRTVRHAQARVARGLWISCPVLLLASDATGPDDRWHEELVTTDSVLDVRDMRRLAPELGTDVTFVEVPGGAHDLALSPAPARDRYLAEVIGFLDARLRTAGHR